MRIYNKFFESVSFYSSSLGLKVRQCTHELKQTVFTITIKLKPKNIKVSAYSSSFKLLF